VIGNNTLDGGIGNDRLITGKGFNILTGGEGKDIFRFTATSSHSVITDFNVADDTIRLESDTFTVLITTDVLAAANFTTGATAVEADDFIVYNSSTGTLFYDADGNGAGVAVVIAMLGTNLALTNADFVVI
jgi:Ca2+-binding RTX toxin-like protein